MGSLLNYVCYGENKVLFVEGQLPPCSMRTKWVAGGCAGFTQHVAEVSEGWNHTCLWKRNLSAVMEQWCSATFGSGSSQTIAQLLMEVLSLWCPVFRQFFFQLLGEMAMLLSFLTIKRWTLNIAAHHSRHGKVAGSWWKPLLWWLEEDICQR